MTVEIVMPLGTALVVGLIVFISFVYTMVSTTMATIEAFRGEDNRAQIYLRKA